MTMTPAAIGLQPVGPSASGDIGDKTQFDALKKLCDTQNKRVNSLEAELQEVREEMKARTGQLRQKQLQLQEAVRICNDNIQQLRIATNETSKLAKATAVDSFDQNVKAHLELKEQIRKGLNSKLGPKHADTVFARIEKVEISLTTELHSCVECCREWKEEVDALAVYQLAAKVNALAADLENLLQLQQCSVLQQSDNSSATQYTLEQCSVLRAEQREYRSQFAGQVEEVHAEQREYQAHCEEELEEEMRSRRMLAVDQVAQKQEMDEMQNTLWAYRDEWQAALRTAVQGLDGERQGQEQTNFDLQDQLLVAETTQEGHTQFLRYHQELMQMSLKMHLSLEKRIARLEAALLWTSHELSSMMGSRALLAGLQSRFRACFPEMVASERDEDRRTAFDILESLG